MLYSTFVVAFSAIASVASAQSGNFTSCCSLDPSTVPTNLRLSWCRAQQNTCPEICPNGQTSANSCDSNTLKADCKCLNGNTPNISDYSQTLASLECDEWKSQCTAAHPNDLNGQTFCQSFTCGKKNATALGAKASGTSGGSGGAASTTAGSSASGTSSSTGSAAASTSSGAAAVLRVGKEYGTGVVGVGLLALFGLVL